MKRSGVPTYNMEFFLNFEPWNNTMSNTASELPYISLLILAFLKSL